MFTNSVNYKFTQRFHVPAKQAYKWCTDFEPTDLTLMNEKGERKIRRATEDTVILTESLTHKGKTIIKNKLVKLNARTTSWYNIHISGPNKNSAFIYQIVPEGKTKSKLIFTGFRIEYSKAPLTPTRIKQIANRERKLDSGAWRLLARSMERDLSKR